jgi:hypothetical protein
MHIVASVEATEIVLGDHYVRCSKLQPSVFGYTSIGGFSRSHDIG